jgi:superfamily I DNA/RNA helicase
VAAAAAARLFAVYVEAKQRQNVLDYDDLLLYSSALRSMMPWNWQSRPRCD